jgi:hypothetical protein
METAKYFQNGLAKFVEIWHTEVPTYLNSIRYFFQFYNIIYFEDTRPTSPPF